MKLLTLTSLIFLASQNLLMAQNAAPTVLKADKVTGNKDKNTIKAIGNVEVVRGKDILFADELIYNKNSKILDAIGNIELKGDEMGNVYASQADMKDDFSQGILKEGQIIFSDGSYTRSPHIQRTSRTKDILQNSIFSFCPNPKIIKNNKEIESDKALISVKSRKTTIDKEDESVKLNNAFFRIKDVPVFYTPYLSFPLRSSKRKSGFLTPSYINTSNLGIGFDLPYYVNIAPNKDLTITPQYHPGEGHLIVNNRFRHLTRKGAYDIEFEGANNNLTQSIEDSSKRWLLKSFGEFEFSDKLGLEMNIHHVGDKEYLRDYHNGFLGFTLSTVNLDHIDKNNYNSLKAVKIQELEPNINSREEPRAIPIFNSYLESKEGKLKEIYSLKTNATVISRRSGLQYRRLSLTPEIVVPYNIAGNIFKASASMQGDFYNLEENFTSTNKTTNFDKTEIAYRPEFALSWSFPLIKKMQKSSFMIEPKAQIVTSSFSNNVNSLANEDVNDTQLTQGNLFLKDRFVGYDRNESGQRVSYGFNSNLFNSWGVFGFGLGQSYRKNDETQDVVLRGFNDSISNIVGEFSYKAPKIFSLLYNFQLNESNYENEINEINANFDFENFSIFSNYILIKETPNGLAEREQATIGFDTRIYGNLRGSFNMTKDFVEDRIISKTYALNYDGCCIVYGISLTEQNFSNLIAPEKSYNINFTIKNL